MKRRVREINPSLADSNYLQIWRSTKKSLNEISPLFKHQVTFFCTAGGLSKMIPLTEFLWLKAMFENFLILYRYACPHKDTN